MGLTGRVRAREHGHAASFVPVVSGGDCSATLRVLEHVDNVNDCVNLPGTAVAYYDSEQTRTLCAWAPRMPTPLAG